MTEPSWIKDVLAEPGGAAAAQVSGDRILSSTGRLIGRVDHGIVRFGADAGDPSIRFYQSLGGADFHGRSKVGYAMTTLETPVYARYLELIRPGHESVLVAD